MIQARATTSISPVFSTGDDLQGDAETFATPAFHLSRIPPPGPGETINPPPSAGPDVPAPGSDQPRS